MVVVLLVVVRMFSKASGVADARYLDHILDAHVHSFMDSAVRGPHTLAVQPATEVDGNALEGNILNMLAQNPSPQTLLLANLFRTAISVGLGPQNELVVVLFHEIWLA